MRRIAWLLGPSATARLRAGREIAAASPRATRPAWLDTSSEIDAQPAADDHYAAVATLTGEASVSAGGA